MSEYIKEMDEEYRSRHYPKGSFYEKAAQENKRGNVTLAVMSGVVSVLLIGLIVFLASLTRTRMAEGNGDALTVGLIFIAIVALLLALCLLGLVVAIRHMKDGVGEAVKKSAKVSGLSEAEIREFDRQAMQTGSCVLALAGKVSAAMSGQKEGILTRDYLWLGDRANTILKREDIVGAGLYHWYYYINKKRVSSLNLAVVNRNNVMAGVEVREDSGKELMKLLSEAHPSIRIHEGILEEGKEFDAWREELAKTAGASSEI